MKVLLGPHLGNMETRKLIFLLNFIIMSKIIKNHIRNIPNVYY